MLNKIKQPGKQIVKKIAQLTLGKFPASKSRLTGKLAKFGGKPVRDVRIRPWASYHKHNRKIWDARLQAQFKKIFISGVEGLPQPLTKQFAQAWANYCECRFGLLLPHGTDALRISLAAVLEHDGLEYGGEVIVPNVSFIASVNAALDRRFGVVFVDVEPDTLLIDPSRVEEAIVPGKTRAILPVHLFGQPANMTALKQIAQRHNLKIVEDAAQAHGASWNQASVGSLGDAAAFSFQSHKNLTSGEGGALTTNDEKVFERAYSMHNVGRGLTNGRWEHINLGWNCRPTEYQAALLIERFFYLEKEQETRRRNFADLREKLFDVNCVEPLGHNSGVSKHGVHMFVMRYKREYCGGLSVDEFLASCGAEGAPIYRGYTCTMSDQPAMQKLIGKHENFFRLMPTPVADNAVKELVFIPQNVFLGTQTDMTDIAAAIRKVERHYA